MDDCGFKDGYLLVYVYEKWGYVDIIQLLCLVNGVNGIWVSMII